MQSSIPYIKLNISKVCNVGINYCFLADGLAGDDDLDLRPILSNTDNRCTFLSRFLASSSSELLSEESDPFEFKLDILEWLLIRNMPLRRLAFFAAFSAFFCCCFFTLFSGRTTTTGTGECCKQYFETLFINMPFNSDIPRVPTMSIDG